MVCDECERISEIASNREDKLIDEVNGLKDRVKELEKALDDVLGEINNARHDLTDAEKIIARMI